VERARGGDYVFLLLMAAFIGLLGGLSAILFDLLIGGFQTGFWGVLNPTMETLREIPRWKILLVPGIGGLVVGLITTFLVAEAKGHGVPEVIKAVALNGGKIRGRVALAKTIASAVTIGSGGSAGREGPIIQIGAAIGSRIGQAIGMSKRSLRTLVGCGAAAGIAATFNAPVAGALFAGEVILGEVGLAQFSPIVISSVIATVVARGWRGNTPVFTAPECTFASPWELLAYILLGLLCGLVSLAYIHLSAASEHFFESRRGLHKAFQPAVGGLMVGAIALVLPQIMGDGHHLSNYAFTHPGGVLLLLALLFAKMIATTLTLGSGGSGGVFSPAITIGALLGAAIGTLAEPALVGRFGGIAAYSLVGMAGLISGSMLAPITAILMVFEITNNYSIILPVMIVAILSTAFVMITNHSLSIYTLKLARDGVRILRGGSPDLLRHLRVRDFMRPHIESIRPDDSASTLMNRMLASPASQFYVTRPDGELLGTIPLTDARRILLSSSAFMDILMAEDLMRRDIPALLPSDTLSSTLSKFSAARLQELPVVHAATERRLLGTLSYSDVLSAYQDEILKADTTQTLSGSLATLSERPVEIAPGFALAEWEPPEALYGKTLAEARLPDTRNLRVLLLKRRHPDGRIEVLLPTARTEISPEDILILLAPPEDIARVM
jgi:CIC family chloride channel protein